MSDRHCTPDELLDVIEGTPDTAGALSHLSVCAECQHAVAELRGVLADVRQAAVPEPSAETWRQLSARVHEAVAREPTPRVVRWQGWPGSTLGHSLAPVLAAALAAVLVAVVFVPRDVARRAATAHSRESSRASAAFIPGEPTGEAVQGDEATADGGRASTASDEGEHLGWSAGEEAAFLAFMGDLAEGLDADAAVSDGLAPTGAATDAAMADLSGEERRELHRMLQDALRGSGV